jgi:hypothetical protein
MVALALGAFPASAETELETDAGEVVIDATVTEVDEETKTLTLVGPGANIIVVKATPEILKRVKVKERITIRYADQVAMALRKADGPPNNKDQSITAEEEAGMNMNPATEAEQSWVQAQPDGSMSELDTIEVSATIAKINKARRIVTFNGPDGEPRPIYVDPSVAGLDDLEVGDRVVMLLTHAVAIDVKTI